MKELFKKEIMEAEDKLQKKGYYVGASPDPYGEDFFDIYDGEMNTVISLLSVAQLTALSNLLTA